MGIYPVVIVSEILGLTPRSVRRLIRQGGLRAIHRRRSIIGVTHAALVSFLTTGRENGGEA